MTLNATDVNGAAFYPADFMDGKTAGVTAVRVTVGVQSIAIVSVDGTHELDQWPTAGLQVDLLPDGHAVEVRHNDRPNAVLVSLGKTLVDALRAARVRVAGLPQGTRLRNLLIANTLAVVALVAGGYMALPYVSQALARQVPMSLERTMGDEIDMLFDGHYCPGAEGEKALLVLQRRIEGPSAPPRELRILNVQMPNAFTFPGGRIVMTRGLIEEAESADEVAGILAHEIQHVEQRHIMSHVIRGAVLTAAWAVTAGDFTGILVVDPSTAFQIANLRFSRGDEESADQGAVAMLDAALVPRDGMVRFFERLKSKSDVIPEWLSTHPSSARRAQDLSAPKGGGERPRPEVLADSDWQAIKHACDQVPDDNRSLKQILFGD